MEIGGWHAKKVRQNAPPQFLEEECAKNHRFVLRQARLLPLARFGKVEVQPLGNDLYVVRAMVENHGYLPTNVSQRALNLNVVKPVEVELGGAEVLMGEAKQALGHLEGRAQATGMAFYFGAAVLQNERRAEWLVRGSGSVTLTVRSDRGGHDRREVALA